MTPAGGFGRGSKNRLTAKDLERFAGSTLFDRIARAVCAAGCLPRKELYEAWEVARRTHRVFRGGRIVDVAGGHGLLAGILLVLDDEAESAVVVDPDIPPSSASMRQSLARAWPRLAGRIDDVRQPIETFALRATDLVVSSHACGALTDRVIAAAVAARARIAVLPCCHDFDTCDRGPLAGWMDGSLAIDSVRALRLEHAGYDVRTQAIPADITSKNRLLLGDPRR